MIQFLLSLLSATQLYAGINHSQFTGAIVESFDEKMVKVQVVNRHFWVSRTNLAPGHLKIGQIIVLPMSVPEALKQAEHAATNP